VDVLPGVDVLALLQPPRLADVAVRVDDTGDDRPPGDIDALRARRHLDSLKGGVRKAQPTTPSSSTVAR
jgi:hypothetical protein